MRLYWGFLQQCHLTEIELYVDRLVIELKSHYIEFIQYRQCTLREASGISNTQKEGDAWTDYFLLAWQ